MKRNLVGLTGKANNGQTMTIIAYRNTNDIDVMFEDGAVVEGTRYPYFKRGAIANPRLKKTSKPRRKVQSN